MNIGQQLKKLRKSWDLTQKEFARRLPGKGDYTYIGKIEREHQYPSIKFLEKIGKTYSVPLSYFFEDHPKATKGMVRSIDVLDWLTKEEKQAEEFGKSRLKWKKYLDYGYFETLAEKIRGMKEEFRKAIEGGSFPV
ncbi:unnamed protein product [marine sediment metagenome]|uniref:HTH cro/C1-type domain-containing protein n=1 Tax=marine sediment metagenome TaxID=412755 RepID=X1HJ75_9ZZZZ